MISSVELEINLINKTMTKDEKILEILNSKPSQKIGLDDFYGKQTVINMLKEAINYTSCCEELNPEFAIGEKVLLTKRTLVSVETFCEDGMIEIDDNNEYYKVDKDELSKRV